MVKNASVGFGKSMGSPPAGAGGSGREVAGRPGQDRHEKAQEANEAASSVAGRPVALACRRGSKSQSQPTTKTSRRWDGRKESSGRQCAAMRERSWQQNQIIAERHFATGKPEPNTAFVPPLKSSGWGILCPSNRSPRARAPGLCARRVWAPRRQGCRFLDAATSAHQLSRLISRRRLDSALGIDSAMLAIDPNFRAALCSHPSSWSSDLREFYSISLRNCIPMVMQLSASA